MIEVNVVGDTKQLSRDLQRIKSRIPSLTAQAVNSLASWARQKTIDETATDLGLPKARISRMILRGKGGAKRAVPRFTLFRANPLTLTAKLKIGAKPIEVTDVQNTEQRRKGGGVMAVGGRFYEGAFKARINGKMRVLKRKTAKRLPLSSPVIGTRKSMQDTFNRHIDGPGGAAFFRRKFKELGDRALAKAGIR